MQAINEVCGFSKLNLVSSRQSAPRSLTLTRNLTSRPSSSNNCRHRHSEVFENKIKSDFNYKFLSESELQAVVKRVQRANQRKRDEEEWKCFLRLRQERDQEATRGVSYTDFSTPRESNASMGYSLLERKSSSTTANLHEEKIAGEGKDKITDEPIQATNLETTLTDNKTAHIYQLGPGLTKRLEDLLSTVGKMTSLLLNPCLHSQYEDEDAERTIKRSLEFDAMFARNHLYEIQRLLKDTKQLTAVKSSNTADLESKISAALKSVTQALQVYTRHVSKGSRVKYQQVVPIFQSIASIQNLLEHLTGQRLFPLRQEIEVSCSYVKQILLEISVTETKTVSTVSHKPVRTRQKHKPSADLSMYNRRKKAEFRRKSASLARARFGPPHTKKHSRKMDSPADELENVDGKLKNYYSECELAAQNNSSKIYDKSQVQPKEPTNAKEVPFRNATRAVPEEHVTTMMEMIPHEKLPTTSKGGVEESNRPASAKSSAREPSNVQLICLKEETSKSTPLIAEVAATQEDNKGNIIDKDSCITLTIEEIDIAEALDYRRKVMDYHNSNPHYKDDKAIGIVDRLSNQILTEMVRDFQQEEMDQVIRILYNLEFE